MLFFYHYLVQLPNHAVHLKRKTEKEWNEENQNYSMTWLCGLCVSRAWKCRSTNIDWYSRYEIPASTSSGARQCDGLGGRRNAWLQKIVFSSLLQRAFKIWCPKQQQLGKAFPCVYRSALPSCLFCTNLHQGNIRDHVSPHLFVE